MHDFLTWPNQYLQKSTPACHPAASEPAFHVFTSLTTLVGLTAGLLWQLFGFSLNSPLITKTITTVNIQNVMELSI